MVLNVDEIAAGPALVLSGSRARNVAVPPTVLPGTTFHTLIDGQVVAVAAPPHPLPPGSVIQVRGTAAVTLCSVGQVEN